MSPVSSSNGTIVTKASRRLLEVAQELRVRITAPFVLGTDNDRQVICLAYFPDFGSPCGMVVGSTFPPAFDTDTRLIQLAEETEIFYSFVNSVAYQKLDAAAFKDVLTDWGYYGVPENRPKWIER